MKNKLALAALLLSAIGTASFAAQPNDPTSTTANGVGGTTDQGMAPSSGPNGSAPGNGTIDNGSTSPSGANNGSATPGGVYNSSTPDGSGNTSTPPSTPSSTTPNAASSTNGGNAYDSSTGNNSGSTYQSTGVPASKGPGLVDGVVEDTNPDRIAAIQEHARQLEAKQFNNYEAPAAGKRHHKHKHGAMKASKPAATPAATDSGTVR